MDKAVFIGHVLLSRDKTICEARWHEAENTAREMMSRQVQFICSALAVARPPLTYQIARIADIDNAGRRAVRVLLNRNVFTLPKGATAGVCQVCHHNLSDHDQADDKPDEFLCRGIFCFRGLPQPKGC